MLLATAHCPLLTQKFMAPNSMYSVTKMGLKKKKGNVLCVCVFSVVLRNIGSIMMTCKLNLFSC